MFINYDVLKYFDYKIEEKKCVFWLIVCYDYVNYL